MSSRRRVLRQWIREICDEYGVALLAEEVIRGFRRTGKLSAGNHFGIEPDIMTVAPMTVAPMTVVSTLSPWPPRRCPAW